MPEILWDIEEYISASFNPNLSDIKKKRILNLEKIESSENDKKQKYIEEGDIKVKIKWKGYEEPDEIDFRSIASGPERNYVLFNLIYSNIKNHNDAIGDSSNGTLLLYVRTSDHKTELDNKYSHNEQIEAGIKYASIHGYKILMLYHNGKSAGFIPIKHEGKVIGHDFTSGYNTSFPDFNIFIGGMSQPYHPTLTHKYENEHEKFLSDFKELNVKALYCLRVDRLTRSSNMMRYLWENLVEFKKIKLVFGVKSEWNLDSSQPHPYLDSELHRQEIFIEACKAEDFERIKMYQAKKAAKTRKRNRDDFNEEDESVDELNNQLHNAYINKRKKINHDLLIDTSSSDEEESSDDSENSSDDGESSDESSTNRNSTNQRGFFSMFYKSAALMMGFI